MRRRTTEWMAAALCAALLIVLAVRLWGPAGDKLGLALRATARWSFLLFWLASCGGALAALFGDRFRRLAEHRRAFGLSFASAHLAHVGLIAWMLLALGATFPRSVLMIFGIAVFWTYLLALLSIRRLSEMLNPTVWRIVRTVGVEYISCAFILDFAKHPFRGGTGHLLAYLPFLVLALAGPALRVGAAVKRVAEQHRLLT